MQCLPQLACSLLPASTLTGDSCLPDRHGQVHRPEHSPTHVWTFGDPPAMAAGTSRKPVHAPIL